MRIAVTADLHYEHSDASRRGAEAVAERICRTEADALVIAGDTFALDERVLHACLCLFDGFTGAKCLVSGNHDLWVRKGGDSWRVHEEVLPKVAGDCGFHYLDHGPAILGRTAIVGNMGWYDYSFHDPRLRVPRRFYERKIGPGLAAVVDSAKHLLDETGDIGRQAMDLGTFWNDARFIRWDFRDEEAVDMMVSRLAEHLDEAVPRVDGIVCVTHHAPFANMVKRYSNPKFSFTNAFMGSERFGEVLLACPKVKYALCGHNHQPCRAKNGPIECINVGGTYPTKRFEIVAI